MPQRFELPNTDQQTDSQIDPQELDNPQDTGSTQEPTPPTNPQPDSPTNSDRYVQLLEQQLREQARQIREQSEQLNASRNAPPPEPEPDPEEERQRYYNSPLTETRKVVKQMLEETISPLISFVNEQKGQSIAQQAIAAVKSDPRFSAHWDAAVEGAVMTAIQAVPPAQVTEQYIQAATVQAIGMKHAGMLGPVAPTPPANNNPAPTNGAPSVTTPPHMRPSNPAAPRSPSNKPAVQLSELEQRLARERGMTPEQYVAWRDMDSKEVAFSDVGRPQPK